jgi:hypothetical protein
VTQHVFILSEQEWLGEGNIRLSMVDEPLHFQTHWNNKKKDSSGLIECLQKIQIKGISDVMHNQFLIYDLNNNQFVIELENLALGKVIGKGIIKEKLIAWEFRASELGFEGFELYERQADGSYLMSAEYATSDQLRTMIQGKLWVKQAS